MENGEHCNVFECNIEIKSEPVDQTDETETACVTATEPTSNAVQNDDSTLPYYSCNLKIEGKELEIPSEQDYDKSDKSCVETDHVALKSNIHSKKLLEGICILETQRIQAIKELDELYELQEQALSDPIAFVEKLQNHNVNYSAPSEIHELPVIDWSKFELNFSTARIRRQQTKLAAKISDLIKSDGEKRSHKDRHPCQKEKPKQRYQLWTAEEQKKLEELLIQFPHEEIQTRRFEKIASFLENRTPGQVAGRVKKYFKTLKKHGIIVKNGMPIADHVKKPCSCVLGPNPSTLLVSHQPSIYKQNGNGEKSNLLQKQKRKCMRHNFFKFWTDEEQKKLDELLIQFPPEEVERSRWEKIAKHLKNRTPFQIAARVKYLKMLMYNGKFVPGKIPGIQYNEISSAEIPRYKHGSNIMQYWTPEEQRRLEELLIVFPPEKSENQRWKKIADCLGNRTPAQVGSRAKNYFVKCKKYGMPVPGRVPRINRGLKFGHKRSCRVNDDCCLFLESLQPHNTEQNSVNSELNASGEKDINQELELMEKDLKEKQSSCVLAHIGYKCSRCNVEPIMGIRWHCTVCSTQSVDFCSGCCASECKEIDGHSFNHLLEAIQVVTH